MTAAPPPEGVATEVRYMKPSLKGSRVALQFGDNPDFTEVTQIRVADGRRNPPPEGFSLQTSGFALLKHETKCPRFLESAEIIDGRADASETVEQVYYPEIIELLKRTTGAEEAVILFHTTRTEHTVGPQRYVSIVHLDNNDNRCQGVSCQAWAEKAGITVEQAAEDFDFVLYNTWQPFDNVVEQRPLALLDPRSIAAEDIDPYALSGLPADLDQTGFQFNTKHRWYYFPRMRPDEVLVFHGHKQRLDSQNPIARQAPHVSFLDPTAPKDALPRRNVECRCVGVFPKKKQELPKQKVLEPEAKL